MNTNERYVARVLLRLKIHESDGTTFETLFTTILEYAHADFIQIKPQGKIGDRKNDGYHPAAGHYYQVYAPENPGARETAAKAAKKAADDFKGLHAYWNSKYPIKQYSFVFNDKFKGSFPEIEAALKKIKDDYGIEQCDCFRARNLEDKLFSLTDDQILMVVGNIPDPDKIQSLDYSLLNEVIDVVRSRSSTVGPQSGLKAPKFDEKIKFNGLSEYPAALLRTASYQCGAIDDYFSQNSTFAKQSLRDELNQLYLDSSASVAPDPSGELSQSDLVFFELLNRMTPRNEKAIQDAALVVIAYYFEACDVFEDPSGGTDSTKDATT